MCIKSATMMIEYEVTCNPKKILKHIVLNTIRLQEYEIINNNFFLSRDKIPIEFMPNVVELDGIYYNKYIFINWRKLWSELCGSEPQSSEKSNVTVDVIDDDSDDYDDDDIEDHEKDRSIDDYYVYKDDFSDDNIEEHCRQYISTLLSDNGWKDVSYVRNIFKIFFTFDVYDNDVCFDFREGTYAYSDSNNYEHSEIKSLAHRLNELSKIIDYFGDDNIMCERGQFVF